MVKRHAKNNAFITNKWLYAFDPNTKTKATRSSLKQTHVLKFKASQHHHLENFLISLSLSLPISNQMEKLSNYKVGNLQTILLLQRTKNAPAEHG